MKKLIIITVIIIIIITAAAAVMIRRGSGRIDISANGAAVAGVGFDFTDSTIYGSALPVCFQYKTAWLYIGGFYVEASYNARFDTDTMSPLPDTFELYIDMH